MTHTAPYCSPLSLKYSPKVSRILGCEDFDEDVDEDFDKDVDEDIDEDKDIIEDVD